MVEEQIINLFCKDKEVFNKYYRYINLNYIKINYNNLYKLFIVINNHYDKYDTNFIEKEELDVSYNANYLLADSERKELTNLLNRIFDNRIENKEIIIELLEQHRKRSLAGDIAKLALDVEDGSIPIQDLMDKFTEFDHQEVEVDESSYVEMDLSKLYTSQIATPGLRWRLNFLNKSLGSLRKGDFGFIFARPETGKTTLLASEISKMVEQTDGDILWFNNEEQSNKVAIRCYQAVLGVTTDLLFSDIEQYDKEFQEITNNKIKIFDFEESSRPRKIENLLKKHNPALIIFDQMDKIKGFKADRNDLELKAIYQWAREIAKKYAPVIAISQASGEAEGKLWLTMDMVDGSKTAKQGEADWILGIGKESDNTSRIRYLNVSKNKLLGDSDSLPDMRHGTAQVIIKPEVARYEDI